MVHSHCSATAVTATDRDAPGPSNVARNATGLSVVAAGAIAGAGSGSSAAGPNPGDSDRRAVAVPVASYDFAASCWCRGCYRDGRCSSFDHDPPAGDVALPAVAATAGAATDRKSTRLNSSHAAISR